MMINRGEPNPAFDNSDILAPATALQLLTDRVMAELTKRNVVISELGQFKKNGVISAQVPNGFKMLQLRNTYQRLLRMLTFKEAGAPRTPTIREEFEVAMVTAYRNKSHHVFYIDAMYRSFFENSTLEVHKDSRVFELMVAGYEVSEKSAQWAYVTAFDNVLRFHPLYVAYLYGANGDVDRENLIIKETVDYMEWLFTRG